MRETHGLEAVGLSRLFRLWQFGDRLIAARLVAAILDQPRDVAGWIGEQGDGEIAHIGDRHDYTGAQPLSLVEVGLQIVDLSVDRNAGAAILVTTDAAVDAALAA